MRWGKYHETPSKKAIVNSNFKKAETMLIPLEILLDLTQGKGRKNTQKVIQLLIPTEIFVTKKIAVGK